MRQQQHQQPINKSRDFAVVECSRACERAVGYIFQIISVVYQTLVKILG